MFLSFFCLLGFLFLVFGCSLAFFSSTKVCRLSLVGTGLLLLSVETVMKVAKVKKMGIRILSF